MKITLKSSTKVRCELQTRDLGDGSFSTILVPAKPETPEHYCVYAEESAVSELKSFPGHAGRPGKRGGSLPRSAQHDTVERPERIPYHAVSDRAAGLFRTKATSTLLKKYNVTVDNIDEMSPGLYAKINSYFRTSTFGKKAAYNKTNFLKHLGAELQWELEQFADAHDPEDVSKNVIVDGVPFSNDVSKNAREVVLAAVRQYNISPETMKNVARISSSPPNGYDIESGEEGATHWVNVLGDAASGVCMRYSPSLASVHLNTNRSVQDVQKTFVHEIGHVVQIYTLKDDAALQKNVREVMASMVEYKRNYGVNSTYFTFGLRAYSFTNANEMFADMYTTVKMKGVSSSEAIKLKAFLPTNVWNALTKY